MNYGFTQVDSQKVKLFLVKILQVLGNLGRLIFDGFAAVLGFIFRRWKFTLLPVAILLVLYAGFYGIYSGLLPENWKAPFKPYVKNIYKNPFPKVGKSDDINLDVITVKSLSIKTSKMEPAIKTSGTLEFFEKVNIASKTSGRIEKFYVREGDIIRKGQILVQMERLPLQLEMKRQKAALDAANAQYGLARERYENARRAIEIKLKEISKQVTTVKELKAGLDKMRITYERKKKVFDTGGISREEIETIRTELITREARYLRANTDLEIAYVGYRNKDIRAKGYKVPKSSAARYRLLVNINTRIQKAELAVARSGIRSAKAALDNTRVLLKETSIRSPIQGIVAARNSSVGEEVRGGAAVNPTEAIMVLVNISRVFAVVNIRETEIKDVERGMPLEFTVDVYPKRKFRARIHIVSPIVDGKTHTGQLKALLANPGMKLKPGMFLRGRIVTGKPRKAVLVPSTALLPSDAGKAFAFVIRDSKVYKVQVSVGEQRDDRIEVKSGLKSGDIIALEKFSQLRDGLTVRASLTLAGK